MTLKECYDALGGNYEDTVRRLYNEKLVESYEILEEKEVSYKCDCNKDKFYKGLITLGKDELNKIFAEEEKIEAECHFCGKRYEFKKEDFKDILEVK